MTSKYEELLARQQAAEKAMKIEPKTGAREARSTVTDTVKTERSAPSRESMQAAADAAMARREAAAPTTATTMGQGLKKGGKVCSASKRADGIAVKGKTRGRMV